MKSNRYWQIDVARGIAIVGMIIYHFIFDLEIIFQMQFGVNKIPLVLLARGVAMLFILLLGISAEIKFQRIQSEGLEKVWINFGKRALHILLWAMVVTTASYFLFPDEFVIFGILHFISVNLVLVVPFLYWKNNYLLILIGISLLGLGIVLPNLTTTFWWLLPFGVTTSSFTTLDYFPLIPWFGITLIGVILGRVFVKQKQFKIRELTGIIMFLERIGQKSLMIYILHQPILFGVLWLVRFFI